MENKNKQGGGYGYPADIEIGAANWMKMEEVGPDTMCLASIAISLKRIADVLDPADKSRGTFFEQADNWFHHWLGAWVRSR